MISNHDFERDETRRQVFRKSSSDLSCECRHPDPDRAVEGRVPWHWHPEIEIDYVTEGKLVFCTADQDIHLQRGEAVFVNANSLHMNYWEGKGTAGSFITILFDQEFLSGMVGSLLERRFLRPVTGSKALQAYVIRPDSRVHLKMLQHILEIYRLFAEEPFAYELKVRNELTDFWCSLMQETDEIRRHDSHTAEVVSERIKPMLECIRLHYAEKLTLDEIAAAGRVSTRECNRIFHRYLRMTPMNYVNFYRLRTAAHKLIQSRDSIEQIAQDCGFSSPSYLARLFKEEYGCSPGEYRRR